MLEDKEILLPLNQRSSKQSSFSHLVAELRRDSVDADALQVVVGVVDVDQEKR